MLMKKNFTIYTTGAYSEIFVAPLKMFLLLRGYFSKTATVLLQSPEVQPSRLGRKASKIIYG